MSDKLEFVAQTSQRLRVQGMVLMDQGLKVVDSLGAELILPLPLNVKMGKLTGSNVRFQDLELVRADKPQETCPMDDFPREYEGGHHQNTY